MIDSTRFTIAKGEYRFGRTGIISDRTLLDVATQYENDITRKFVAIQADQLTKRFPGDEPVLSTLKYDGEGIFIYYQKENPPVAFSAPAGGARVGFPALTALAAHLRKQKVEKALFRAELYLPSEQGTLQRFRSADVNRLSHQGSEAEQSAFKLAIFDVIMLDGRDLRPNRENFSETWKLLESLVGKDDSLPFHRPAGGIIPSSELSDRFAKLVSAGEEGLVIRRLQRPEITKVKPDITIDAAVIGYVEGEFEGKYGVTSLLTSLTYPNAAKSGNITFQTLARAGSGLSDEQRTQMLEVLSPLKTTPPLPMSDSDGRTIHFVKPTIIVELRGEDLNPSSKERENRTQVFEWDGAHYAFKGMAACPRLTFATFRQIRADKSCESGGARISQLGIESKSPEIRLAESKPPTVVRREVYVKAEAVRKLIITEQTGEEVLPYLIYWVDFSSKRKDPLKIVTQAAFTRQRADKIAETLITEGVTKGFLLHGGPTAPSAAAAPAPAKPEFALDADAAAAPAPKKKTSKKKEAS